MTRALRGDVANGSAFGQSFDGDEDEQDDWTDLDDNEAPELDDEPFDPEPTDEEVWDDLSWEDEPDDDLPPPDELWCDADWE